MQVKRGLKWNTAFRNGHLLLFAILLLLSSCRLPSEENLISQFKSHKQDYERLYELIITEKLKNEALNSSGLIDQLEQISEYNLLINNLGISQIRVRDLSSFGEFRPGIFFVIATGSGLVLVDRGIAFYPNGPDLSYRRRVVPSLDQAEQINISESTETYQKIVGEWYIYEKFWT